MKYIIERENYENSSDELMHWKYIDKKKLPSGKYRYIYDKSKRTVSNEKIRRKAQTHFDGRVKQYHDELDKTKSKHDKKYENFIKENGDPSQWDDSTRREAEALYSKANFEYQMLENTIDMVISEMERTHNDMLYFSNSRMPEIAGKVKNTIKKIDLKKNPALKK